MDDDAGRRRWPADAAPAILGVSTFPPERACALVRCVRPSSAGKGVGATSGLEEKSGGETPAKPSGQLKQQ